MSMQRGSKMLHYINYRLKVTLGDKRELVGTFLAYDKNMNVVLGDCEERRPKKGLKPGDEGDESFDLYERRFLGLLLLRGDSVVSLSVIGPPPNAGRKKRIAPAGNGIGKSVGRGRGITTSSTVAAPRGLSGPSAAFQPMGMNPRGMQAVPRGMPPRGIVAPRGYAGAPPPGYGGPPPPGYPMQQPVGYPGYIMQPRIPGMMPPGYPGMMPPRGRGRGR
eukprot:g1077.t1